MSNNVQTATVATDAATAVLEPNLNSWNGGVGVSATRGGAMTFVVQVTFDENPTASSTWHVLIASGTADVFIGVNYPFTGVRVDVTTNSGSDTMTLTMVQSAGIGRNTVARLV